MAAGPFSNHFPLPTSDQTARDAAAAAQTTATAAQTGLDGRIPHPVPNLAIPTVAGTLGTVMTSASGALVAGRMYVLRCIAPSTKSLRGLFIPINGFSGNARLAVYDTGEAAVLASGPVARTRVYDSGSIALTANGWTDMGDPNLPLVAGQPFEVSIQCDNATAAFGRVLSQIGSTQILPTVFGTTPGGVSLRQVGFHTTFTTYGAPPSTITDAELAGIGAGTAIPLVIGRMA